MSLVAELREAISPEAVWRRPDPDYRVMVHALSVLLSVPIYHLTRKQCATLGEFFADSPERAVELYARVNWEAAMRVGRRKQEQSRVRELTLQVLARLFTDNGLIALLESGHLFREARPIETEKINEVAAILAKAAVFDISAIRQLPDYEDALKRGRELATTDDTLADASTDYLAFAGKHWLMYGDLIERAFEKWLTARGMRQALSKYLGP